MIYVHLSSLKIKSCSSCGEGHAKELYNVGKEKIDLTFDTQNLLKYFAAGKTSLKIK